MSNGNRMLELANTLAQNLTDTKTQVEQLVQEVLQLRNENEELRKLITIQQETIKRHNGVAANAEAWIAEKDEYIEELRELVTAQEAQIEKLRRDLKECVGQLDVAKEKITKYRSMWNDGAIDAPFLCRLRQYSTMRLPYFGHSNVHDWNCTDWATAAGGEMGELLNLIKKYRRGDFDNDTAKMHLIAIGREIADVIIYTDFVAAWFGIELQQAITEKFNEVSDRKNCPIKL